MSHTASMVQPVALITGASQGIGRAIAEAMAGVGYSVALAARRWELLDTLRDTLAARHPGQEFWAFPVDLADTDTLDTWAVQVQETIGQPVHTLVNNAGICHPIGLLTEISPDTLRRLYRVNLEAPTLLTHALLPPMVVRGEGDVVFINSSAGREAFPYWSAYGASKWGLRCLAEAVREEQRQNGIRVVSVYPGAVHTDIWDAVDQATADTLRQQGRQLLTAEDVAEAVVWALTRPRDVLVKDIDLSPLRPAL